MDLKYLPHYWKRGTDFLGVKYAIMCGAMTWVSEANLVAAVSNAGGFGVIAGGNMPPDLLAAEIKSTRNKTDMPFGVNLITIAPNFPHQLEVLLDMGIEYIFFAGSIPSGTDIKRVKEAGRKVVCFSPVLSLAKRLIRMGIDALIIEGNEAGGHIGPVSTSVLAQEFLPVIKDIPVFVAGGIGTGEIVASYLLMGASGAQMGTRFVAATECVAHPDFKKAFIRASARDAVPTAQFDPSVPVIPVRAITNDGTKEFNNLQLELIGEIKAGRITREEAQVKLEEFWIGALRRGVQEGDVERGSLMAGQSVAFVKEEQSVEEIINEIVTGAEEKLRDYLEVRG